MNFRRINNDLANLRLCWVLFSLMHYAASETRGLHFPTICDHYKERDVTSEVSYVVTWKGERAPSATCRLGFTGPVADSIYTRSVCFDTIYFNVKDCAVRLEFSEESGTKATNYSCTHKPKAWCAEKDQTAYINLFGANLHPNNSSSFKILVTAEKTSTLLYLKIGIIVGLVCLCVTGILVAVCCYKKKQKVVKDAELEYTRLAEWGCLNSPSTFVKNIIVWMTFASSGSRNLIKTHVQNINIQKAECCLVLFSDELPYQFFVL